MYKLLLLLSTITGIAQPDVGFLRIYNCMSQQVQFTPMLDSRALTVLPLEVGEQVSGVYFLAGAYTLTLKGAGLPPLSREIDIMKGQTLSVVALHLPSQGLHGDVPTMISLSDHFAQGGGEGVPLQLKSYSSQDVSVKLSGRTVELAAMQTQQLARWNNKPFTLYHGGKRVGKLRPRSKLPHTLLVWDNSDKGVQVFLLDHARISSPVDLRDDMSHGKRRAELPNLQKLSPR